MNGTAKHIADAGAGVITIGAIVDLLPEATAVLSLIWVALRIYETDTVQRLLGNEPKDGD
tara:strand:- start:407 stop:586 length:180 start_codon:yes stop_codon:yes gene_type:complete